MYKHSFYGGSTRAIISKVENISGFTFYRIFFKVLKLNEFSNLTSGIEGFDEVQTAYNNFTTQMAWIAMVPSLFMALIAGALSDDFGRKPLMLFPVTGLLLRNLSNSNNLTIKIRGACIVS
jgi:MFS family permease